MFSLLPSPITQCKRRSTQMLRGPLSLLRNIAKLAEHILTCGLDEVYTHHTHYHPVTLPERNWATRLRFYSWGNPNTKCRTLKEKDKILILVGKMTSSNHSERPVGSLTERNSLSPGQHLQMSNTAAPLALTHPPSFLVFSTISLLHCGHFRIGSGVSG